jgi:hypothetical protein
MAAAHDSTSSPQRPLAWWQWWFVYPTLGVALLTAIPTLVQGIQALRIGTSFSDVPFATQKAALFAKNFDCLRKSSTPVQLRDNTRVEAVVCDSGDIWIRVTTAANQSGITWVTPPEVIERGRSGMLVGPAFAAASSFQLAQSSSQVLCVFRDRSGRITRRVAVAPGKCQDEQIDPYSGRVTVVPADCSCPR